MQLLIGLAVINIIILIIIGMLIILNQKSKRAIEKSAIQQLEKQIVFLQTALENRISNQSIELAQKDEMNLAKVDNRLTNQNVQIANSINQIMGKVAKLDASQQQLLELGSSIDSLKRILGDKKTRGMYGELQLQTIFQSIFGEKNDNLFAEQVSLSTGVKVDFVIHAPAPLGMIAIDSKFPLENYEKMIVDDLDKIILDKYRKEFKNNVKKHINDIASKYIIEGETADQAIMFIPSEAIFSEINAYHQDLIDLAHQKKVAITSPTTIVAVLNILQILLRDIKRAEHAKVIDQHLKDLGQEFERLNTRFVNLMKSNERVYKDINDVSITANKLIKKFDKINQGEIGVDDDE
ncbi:MAG: DNA recombination protein RmuC [Mycoplasmatales bacterium]